MKYSRRSRRCLHLEMTAAWNYRKSALKMMRSPSLNSLITSSNFRLESETVPRAEGAIENPMCAYSRFWFTKNSFTLQKYEMHLKQREACNHSEHSQWRTFRFAQSAWTVLLWPLLGHSSKALRLTVARNHMWLFHNCRLTLALLIINCFVSTRSSREMPNERKRVVI